MGIIFKPNKTFQQGGGLTSKIVPFQLTKFGIGAGIALGGAAAIGSEMFRNRNKMQMGPVSYAGGPARMTHNVDSGAVEAIMQTTNNPAVQSDMLKRIVKDTDDIYGNLEEFGVDEEFVSAFYGMGN